MDEGAIPDVVKCASRVWDW